MKIKVTGCVMRIEIDETGKRAYLSYFLADQDRQIMLKMEETRPIAIGDLIELEITTRINK